MSVSEWIFKHIVVHIWFLSFEKKCLQTDFYNSLKTKEYVELESMLTISQKIKMLLFLQNKHHVPWKEQKLEANTFIILFWRKL